jgi:glycogen synthase
VRILHIFDHSIPLHSGYTFRSAAILREQRRRGWETYHLTSSRQISYTERRETVDGLEFFRTPLVSGAVKDIPVVSNLADMQALSKRLAEVITEVRPNILHAHSPVLNAIPTLYQGRRFNLPVVYEVRAFWEDAAVDHGDTSEGSARYRATRALETFALKRASAVTCICSGLRDEMVTRGLAPEKITIIPNAVDAEKFQFGVLQDANLKDSLGLGTKRVLGFVGSFYAYEGLDLLLNAMPQLLSAAPDLHLLLVGGGPQEQNLRKLVDRLGLNDNVTFTGRVEHRDVARYYGLIDVLVYARHSMRLTELVTPLKPLEAMAQGHLFVASDVGGHKELIEDGITGTLFKAGNIDDLSRATLQLLNSSHLWQSMRLAGRTYVESQRTWTRSVARYEELYNRLLNRMKGRAE